MRIPLDRKQLLGFENCPKNLDVPAIAAKVGNKPTFGVRVSSASHGTLAETGNASTPATLIYPVKFG